MTGAAEGVHIRGGGGRGKKIIIFIPMRVPYYIVPLRPPPLKKKNGPCLYKRIFVIVHASSYPISTEKIDGLFRTQSDVVIPATNMASTTSFTVSIDERQREPLMYED